MLWIPHSIGKKHFALVGLPSHHSGCIETNANKSRYRVEKRFFDCSPRRDNEVTKCIFVLNLILAMLTGKISPSVQLMCCRLVSDAQFALTQTQALVYFALLGAPPSVKCFSCSFLLPMIRTLSISIAVACFICSV